MKTYEENDSAFSSGYHAIRGSVRDNRCRAVTLWRSKTHPDDRRKFFHHGIDFGMLGTICLLPLPAVSSGVANTATIIA